MILNNEQVVTYVNYSLIVSGIFIIFCICMFLYFYVKHLLFLRHIKKYQKYECKCVRCGTTFISNNQTDVICDQCIYKYKIKNNIN